MMTGSYNGVEPKRVKPIAKNRKLGWMLLTIILSLLVGSIVFVQMYNMSK